MFSGLDGKFTIFCELLEKISNTITKSPNKRNNKRENKDRPPKNLYRGPPKI